MFLNPKLQKYADLFIAQPIRVFSGNVVPRPISDTLNFIALHCQNYLALARIACNNLKLCTKKSVQDAREKLRVSRRAISADNHLGSEEVAGCFMRRCVPRNDHADLTRGAADPMNLTHIEPHSFHIKQGLKWDSPLNGANHGTVFLRKIVDVIGGG